MFACIPFNSLENGPMLLAQVAQSSISISDVDINHNANFTFTSEGKFVETALRTQRVRDRTGTRMANVIMHNASFRPGYLHIAKRIEQKHRNGPCILSFDLPLQ
jgi:hypothetical protein